MEKFELKSEYKPAGDQPKAIAQLTAGINSGLKQQALLGVTGSGKTFTMANIIANVNKPTLVLAHNKTLAAQLCNEFKELFPNNAVEFFVSYYDYYQPEAYLPGKDVYIEKDSSINDEIDRLRHSATSALFERRDVIIVSSVSCIYTLGDPASYSEMMVSLRVGQIKDRDAVIDDLVRIRYVRNDFEIARGLFRVKGDVIEVFPASEENSLYRIQFFDDEVEKITKINPISGEVLQRMDYVAIFPTSHHVADAEHLKRAIDDILHEMDDRIDWFESQHKLIEAQRIKERTLYDVECLRQLGYCSGVENYSRVIAGRAPGSTPYTLLDYFPSDYLLFVDESHVTLPQVKGMSGGDRARKKNLVDYGFRLPSAYDNRPLFFDEFSSKINQVIYVSATPGEYERTNSSQIVEQIIRPTGLVDPEIIVKPTENQIDDLIANIYQRVERRERVMVLTITKRLAESLSEYLKTMDIKVRYLHHDIDTLERIQTLHDLRSGEFDVIVGINLLREGIDIPEVSLIAILDADKEGFLRNETSLIQIIGRAARNAEGQVIMYADSVTPSMEKAIRETERRRFIQQEHNRTNGIIPKTIVKKVKDNILPILGEDVKADSFSNTQRLSSAEKKHLVEKLTSEMQKAAKNLDFEYAAQLRDRLKALKEKQK